MSASQDKVLAVLRSEVKSRRENQLQYFQPYPKQIEFANATALPIREIILQAGNQVGKSEVGAYMAAVFATGKYPDWWRGRRFDGPTRGWATGESSTAVRDISQRKLVGPPGDAALFGTGKIPKSLLVGTILGHGAGGAYDMIRVKHVSGGVSEIAFKSYEMERTKWQGATLDWLWCDEEPPLDLYLEGLARLGATEGLAYSTFTPLSGFNLILPRFLHDKSPEARSQRTVVRMKIEDAGHFQDEGKRKSQVASYAEYQRKTRADGAPMLGSGAVFEDVELDSLLEPLRVQGDYVSHATIGVLDTRGWSYLWAVDFGIDHPFAAVLLGWDRDADIVHVLAEVKIKGGVPAIHAERMKSIAANVPVAWPHDGNARDKGSGEQLAQIYKAQGLLMLPTHATHPTGGYSTEAGIMDMLDRMRSGRLLVAAGLREWQEEFLGYHRKDGLIVKTNDDLLSATRIGVMAIRNAKPVGLGSRRRNNGPHIPQRYDGADEPDSYFGFD